MGAVDVKRLAVRLLLLYGNVHGRNRHLPLELQHRSNELANMDGIL